MGSLAGAILAVGATMAGLACATGEPPRRIGGCQTVESNCGLPAIADSSALAALSELLAPGAGPKAGPACRRMGVDTMLFAQIGAVTQQADTQWRTLGAQLTVRLAKAGVLLCERSQLRHTTGTCFPPYHLDFRACGDSAAVQQFLENLAAGEWPGSTVTADRQERKLTITAGRSLQLMGTVVHLR